MKKVAVVTDSNSGITQRQSAELGVHVIPMPVVIDGAEYFEGISIDQAEFYGKLMADADITTSQPTPGSVLDLWDRLLEEYDELVHIPMSGGLSSACQTALMLAEDYDDRVQVVNNQRISVTQRRTALDALALANAGWDAVRIREYMENTRFDSSIYIMVDTLSHLKKGGRITPAAAAIGSLLNIKPVLQIQGEKLDYFTTAMGAKQAREAMIKAMRKDFDKRFAEFASPDSMWLDLAYTYDEAAALDFKLEVEKAFPGYDIHMDPLSLSVSCHIGPGALAIACARRAVAEQMTAGKNKG